MRDRVSQVLFWSAPFNWQFLEWRQLERFQATTRVRRSCDVINVYTGATWLNVKKYVVAMKTASDFIKIITIILKRDGKIEENFLRVVRIKRLDIGVFKTLPSKFNYSYF